MLWETHQYKRRVTGAVDKDAGQSRSYIIPFALLCSLFFLWAVANNLNDILLPQFQQAFTLTNFQAGLIQSAFYFGYFIIPIPAGFDEKNSVIKAKLLPGYFYMPWVLHYSGPRQK